MGLFNFNKKETPSVQPVQPVELKKNFTTSSVSLDATYMPKVTESANQDWVLNGNNNSFPKELSEMIDNSPTQSAILSSASLMTAGQGILFGKTKDESEAFLNGLDELNKKRLMDFIQNMSPNEDINNVIHSFISDFKKFGYAFLEVIYNRDYSRPIQINYVDVFKMAIGKKERVEINGAEELVITHFYYCEDWSKKNVYPPVRINAFNPLLAKKNRDGRQIIYITNKSNGLDYYGKPSYYSALKAIKTEGLVQSTNLNNIENSFSPNVLIKFYNEPTPEEQQKVEWGFKNTMKGIGQKLLFLYWSDKDTAPDVEPINVENFDSKIEMVNDLTIQAIITANRVHPAVVGVQTQGKLGYSNEIQMAFDTYYNSVIVPERRIFERIVTNLFNLNGFEVEVKFEDIPFNFGTKDNNQTTLKIIK